MTYLYMICTVGGGGLDFDTILNNHRLRGAKAINLFWWLLQY